MSEFQTKVRSELSTPTSLMPLASEIDLDLNALVGTADRTILVAGLQALHRERVAAWNAATSVAIIRNEKQPAMEQFGIDEVATMLRRVGAGPSSY